MKQLFLFLILSLIIINSKSQSFTLSGIVRDSLSEENLVNVLITDTKTGNKIKSNEYGFYSIKLTKGENSLIVEFPNYEEKIININIEQSSELNIKLQRQSIELQQIIVKGNKKTTTTEELPLARLQKIPSLAGETDVIKALIQMPGVSAGTEGSAGLNVRGGSPDQNLYLLDDVPVYNVNHVFGFVSVFNTDAIKSVKMYKGGIPSQYSGRSSSVIDMYMKDGDMHNFHGDISIGIISSKLLLEGPIIKDKCSFIVTARRSYIDILFRPFSKSIADNTITVFYFYDVNAKINYKINEKNRLFISFYSGQDKFFVKYNEIEKDSIELHQKYLQSISWGNITTSLRWLSILSEKISINTSLFYTQFNYLNKNEQNNEFLVDGQVSQKKYLYESGSGIQEAGFRTKIDYFLNNKNHIKIGATASYLIFKPSFSSEMYNDEYSELNKQHSSSTQQQNSLVFSTFLQDAVNFGFMGFDFGVNFNGFNINNKTYYFTEPRARIWISPVKSITIESSYSSVHQTIHLLTNSTIGLPTDLWVPATERISPISSKIYDAGLIFNISKKYTLSISAFYKNFNNLIQYKSGADFLDVATSWQDKTTNGKGWSYGLETSFEGNFKKMSISLSYTYMRSFRKFDELNNGNTFRYKYDRPHNFNFQVVYNLKKNISLSALWVVMSGQTATVATQYFMGSDNFPRPYIEEINNLRFPIYNRLDLAINIVKNKRKSKRIWSLGLYNVYNRLNPLYLTPSGQAGTYTGVSFSPIMPFVNYSIKF